MPKTEADMGRLADEYRRGLGPQKFRLKIVPKAAPNDDGRWIEVVYAGDTARDWSTMKHLVPEDHFIVNVEEIK